MALLSQWIALDVAFHLDQQLVVVGQPLVMVDQDFSGVTVVGLFPTYGEGLYLSAQNDTAASLSSKYDGVTNTAYRVHY